MAFFDGHDTAAVGNQRYLIHFKNYYFQIIIKNLTQCNTLNIFAFSKYGKLANHNSKEIVSLVLGFGIDHCCPWPSKDLSSKSRSLASDFFFFLSL